MSETTPAKPATKRKPATPNMFAKVQDLIKQIIKLDEEAEVYEYEGLRLEIADYGVSLRDDYNDNHTGNYKTLADIEKALQTLLAKVIKEQPRVVKDIDGSQNYSATIDEAGITVGCTHIGFDKFDEIAKHVAEVRKGVKAKIKATTVKVKKLTTSPNPYGTVTSY